jgi:tRNA modification GTPase
VRAAETAELRLLVAAADQPPPETFAAPAGESVIRVLNKTDLVKSPFPRDLIPVSALTGEGLDKLKDALFQAAAGDEAAGESSVSRERHYAAVSRAREALVRAREGLRVGQPGEIIAEELREALEAADELTGRRRLEGLLDEIFAAFCIGK